MLQMLVGEFSPLRNNQGITPTHPKPNVNFFRNFKIIIKVSQFYVPNVTLLGIKNNEFNLLLTFS